MQVRRAVSDDLPWLLAQLRDFAASYPMRRSLFGSDSHAEALVGTLIRDQYVAVATNDAGARVGLIAGTLIPHPFNPDLKVASELWWFVTKEERGTRAGLALLNDFNAWADQSGAALVNFTLEAASPVREHCLTKRGFVLAERQFIREIDA